MEPSEKEEIRNRTDIVDLISGYTLLKRQGSKYKGLCPFHVEKTPSFTVDPGEGRWHCWGACGTHGDIFTFIERAENLTFIEAAQRLAERAGVTLTPRGGDREAAQRNQSERERVFAANAIALEFFRQCFRRDTVAREYANARGLAHETLENFQVGYAPDDWGQLAEYLQKQKIHAEDAEKAGLIFSSKFEAGRFTDRFRGRLMFPIVDVQERVVGFGGRLLADAANAPKYLNSPESPVFSKSKVLYGLNRARKSIQAAGKVLIVEGYVDVVAAHQAGIEFVVATLGTSLTEEHVRLIRRYLREDNKNVILSFDADDAGVKAALRAAELIQASGDDLTLKVLSLPQGEDPDSLIRKGQVALFHKAIDSALSFPEFRIKSFEKKHDTTTDTGKLALLREAVAVIAAVPSILDQDMLIRSVAAFHPSFSTNSLRAEESVRAEVQRARGSKGAAGNVDPLDPGGGSANYRPGNGPVNNNRWDGGSNGPSGGFKKRRPYGQPERIFVQPDPAPTPVLRPASELAERTLLQALLSDEWRTTLLRLSPAPPVFEQPAANRLAELLWPRNSEPFSARETVGKLTDPELIEVIDIARRDDDGEPLSEVMLEHALRQLTRVGSQQQLKEIATQGNGQKEGESGLSDELLRRWSEIKRAEHYGKFSEDK